MNPATQTAKVSAIGLAVLSVMALGAALSTVDGHRHWDRIVGMVLVMVLLGWASAAERVEWKANEAHQFGRVAGDLAQARHRSRGCDMSPLRIEDEQALPAGWCWCADNWLIAGIADFVEGGKLHSREGCWKRLPQVGPLGLQDALDVTFPCCEHCPCIGRKHAAACPVDGCEGGIGS